METVAPLAGTISTYGLYAIVAVLTVAVVYLYKLHGALEKEFREMLKTTIGENKQVIAENTRVVTEATRLIERLNDK